MTEMRLRPALLSGWLAVLAAALVAGIMLAFPVAAAAATTRSVQPLASVRASLGSQSAARAGRAPLEATTDAEQSRPAANPGRRLFARLGEARRSNGLLGQWVVGVLVVAVVLLWVVLVAAVVRLRLRFAGGGAKT